MGCASGKNVQAKEEKPISQINKKQNEGINIKGNPDENEIEKKEQVLYLKYETTLENEKIRIFGNDVDEFDDYTTPFFEREYNKFELYEDDNKICNFMYTFKKSGIHTIKMVLKENITNFSYMFYDCNNLKGITGYIDTSDVRSLFWMLNNCSSLIDISSLKYWDIRNVKSFDYMFNECTSLSDISPLENWDMSGDKSIISMFSGCTSLKDIKPLEKWNMSNYKTLNYLFSKCTSLCNISYLKEWNVSNTKNFIYMFSECSSLKDISPLKDWDVRNGEYFRCMFYKCTSLTDAIALKNWNVNKGKDLSRMFQKCNSLKNVDELKKKFGENII